MSKGQDLRRTGGRGRMGRSRADLEGTVHPCKNLAFTVREMGERRCSSALSSGMT